MNTKKEKEVHVHSITIRGEEGLITIQSPSKEFCERYNKAIAKATNGSLTSHIGTSKDKPCVRNY